MVPNPNVETTDLTTTILKRAIFNFYHWSRRFLLMFWSLILVSLIVNFLMAPKRPLDYYLFNFYYIKLCFNSFSHCRGTQNPLFTCQKHMMIKMTRVNEPCWHLRMPNHQMWNGRVYYYFFLIAYTCRLCTGGGPTSCSGIFNPNKYYNGYPD